RLLKTQFHVGNNGAVRVVGWVVLVLLCWILLYLLVHDEMLPGGEMFKLAVLMVVAVLAGMLAEVIKLPPLLGMLIAGVVLRSVGFFSVTGAWREVVVASREVALMVILIKAGLGLDGKALKRMSVDVLKLSLIPCIAEATAAAIAAHFIFGLPWFWAFLLGFLLSPVSPAVVVPSLLALKEKGYGEDKGIPTLVIASASIDDIASISLFGVFLAMLFSKQGDLVLQILHGPLELVIGLVAGIVWGLVSSVIPHRDDYHVTLKRSAMIGAGGLGTILGTKEAGFDGAGPLCCVTAAFVAGVLWKYQRSASQDSAIGTEIDVRQLDVSIIGSGISVIAICLSVRILMCFLVLLRGSLNWKEMAFVNMSWLPKATVQAALSPQALDIVRSQDDPDKEDLYRAGFLLTTAILAILITAPIGSIAINVSGPYLLTKHVPNNRQPETRL
ncbi:hypothetical protein AAG570_001650, partial [Ranatra chinensis]